MTLKDYPIKFDETELFRPEKWSESYETIETVSKTEAGTDSVVVTRDDKMTIFCEFACTDEWKAFFKAYSRRRFFYVSLYDTELEDYVTKKMRLRNFKSDTEIYSDVETESVGLYSVTFNLIEF